MIRSWGRALVLSVVGVAAAGACAWDSFVPEGRPIELPENAPKEILTLGLCAPATGVLDCGGEHECNYWYRMDITQPGTLHLQLLLSDLQTESALTRLLLRPLGQPVLAQKVSTYGDPLEIDVPVSPDVYGVLVQGGEGYRKYQLLASVSPPGEATTGLSCPNLPADVPEVAPDDGD